jgi:hypothetical protein
MLETPDGAALQGMSSFHWGGFVRRLSALQHNNGLVITLERLPVTFPADRRNLVQAWEASWPGERVAVQWNMLQRHLSHRAAHAWRDEPALESRLQDWRQHAGLAALMGQQQSPGQIANLADLLLPVLTGRCDLDTALARHELHVAEAVQNWFDSGAYPLEVKTLLVAAAVCNEALADEVDAAADDLLRLLTPAKQKAEAEPLDPFAAGSTRSRRFKQIGASLVQMPLHGLHYGSTSGQMLRLDNSAWQKAVINYVWNELSSLREPLLEWLERLVTQGSARLRVRAAAAVGALARLNFPLLEARILRRWAPSGDPNLRRAAAQVLGVTMWDEQHSAASIGLLRHWAALDQWRLCWTAATACGGLAGQRYLQQTLATLGKIAEACVEHPQLLAPVTQAMLNLFLAARNAADQRAVILHTLRQWSERRPAAKGEQAQVFAAQRTAVLCFWTILWPAPNDRAWRQLVEDMAVPQSPQQDDGVALLRASLNFRQSQYVLDSPLRPREQARQGLRDVSAAVAKEGGDLLIAWTGVLRTLEETCRRADALSDTGAERQRLRYYAENWTDLPPDAAALRSLLL